MMELKQYGDFLVSHQRQGHDKNGNPIYIVNVFSNHNGNWCNTNMRTGYKLDKYGNIKMQSYNISMDIDYILKYINI